MRDDGSSIHVQGPRKTSRSVACHAPCAMRCPRPRSASTGAAAVDGKARQDSVDAGARTAEDARTARASKVSELRRRVTREQETRKTHRGQWRMRVRRTTGSRQHPTGVKETTTGSQPARARTEDRPAQHRHRERAAGGARFRRRRRRRPLPPASCAPHLRRQTTPVAQPDLSGSCACVPSLSRAIALTPLPSSHRIHTSRAGTPGVPYSPVSLYSHA